MSAVTIKGLQRTCTTWLNETLKINFGLSADVIYDKYKHALPKRTVGKLFEWNGEMFVCTKNPIAWLASIRKFSLRQEPETWRGGDRGWSIRLWADEWNTFYGGLYPLFLKGNATVVRQEDALFCPLRIFQDMGNVINRDVQGEPIDHEVVWQMGTIEPRTRSELIDYYSTDQQLLYLTESEITEAAELINWDIARVYGYDITTTHSEWNENCQQVEELRLMVED